MASSPSDGNVDESMTCDKSRCSARGSDNQCGSLRIAIPISRMEQLATVPLATQPSGSDNEARQRKLVW